MGPEAWFEWVCSVETSPDCSVALYDLGRFSTQRQKLDARRISTGPTGRRLTRLDRNVGVPRHFVGWFT